MGSKSSSKPPTPAPAAASFVDQYNPYGSQTYRQIGTVRVANGPDQPRYAETTTMTPQQQQLFNQEQSLNSNLNQFAIDQTGQLRSLLGKPADFSHASGQQVQEALYGRNRAMLDPQFQQEEQHLNAQLAAQGVNPGSGAYDQAMNNYARRKQGAYEAARQDAITGGGAEQNRQVQQIIAQRDAPINEIAALLGTGGQVSMPQFDNGANAVAANATTQANQSAMAGYQANQQQQQATMGGLFGLAGNVGAAYMLSDLRLKDIIRPAGELGPFKLWFYRFKGEDRAQLGVIAQEVQEIAPHLVIERRDGMLAVDYDSLLNMVT